MRFRTRLSSWLLLSLMIVGCGKSGPPETLKTLPVDSLDGVLTQTGVTFDGNVSSDGKGSIQLNAPGPTVFRLYEVSGIDVEDARLTYRARIKTKDVKGQVFLEMWCVFPGRGEYFSRALQSPLSGTLDWVTQETPFFLQKGQKPELIKLNLVINGTGTAWIDDISLVRGPLQ